MEYTDYKENLKKSIIEEIEKLNPTKIEPEIVDAGKCPICCEDEYVKLPEYNHYHCNNCMYETGLKSYQDRMSNKMKIYEDINKKIRKYIEQL